MGTKIRKLISVCLAVIMMLSVLTVAPICVGAAENNNESVSDTYTSGDFEYRVLKDGTAEITEYVGFDYDVSIPKEFDGYVVSSIGDWAFTQQAIQSVAIPDSVIKIKEGAFCACPHLSKIVIPDSVTMIGYNAFGYTAWYENKPLGLVYAGKVVYCYKGEMEENTQLLINYGTKGIADNAFENYRNLASITLPETMESIGCYAFSGTDISSITIPARVSYIDETAFSESYSLETIIVDITNPYYSSSHGVLFNKDKTKILRYPIANKFPTYNVPEGVTEIGRAFSNCKNLEKVYLPDGVTKIDDSAFEDSGITSITLPDGLKNIGRYAFNYCIFLKTITIPDSVTNIGSGAFNNTEWYDNKPDKSVIYAGKIAYKYKGEMPANTKLVIKDGTKIIQEYAFLGCNGLVEINISDSVIEIGSGAFENCSNLNSIMIPNNLSEIKNNTFKGCSKLEEVKIGENVTSIGEYAFQECTNLKNINIPNSVKNIGSQAFEYCKSIEEIILPENLEEIAYRAFFSCDNLKNVTLACSTHIATDAFMFCSNLLNVAITGNGEWEDNIFYNTGLLSYCERVVIQYGVTEIGNSIFSGYNIRNVSIPNSVTKIGMSAFADCTQLQSITIPNSVKEIGSNAFSNCKGLQNVVMSNNVKSIGHYAFINCSGLSEIKIPSKVDFIGYYALGYRGDYSKVEDFTIKSYIDTAAETYANENGFTFIALDSQQIGDVNGDGSISIDDATNIQKYLANMLDFTSEQEELADVDKNGSISIDDVTLIQKYIAGLAEIG